MKKKASLKKKMNSPDKGEKSTSNFELPEARPSLLRKQFQIKLEKLINNLGGTNEDIAEIGLPGNNEYQKAGSNRPLFMSASQEQFNLSNFAASGQASLNSNKVLQPTKTRSGVARMTQPNVPDQNHDPKNCVNTTKKLLTMEASTAESRGYRQYMTRSKGSIQIQDPKTQPMKKAVVDNSSTMQPMKNTVAEDDNSRAKQESMRRAVAENKQPMKKAVVDNSSTKKHMKNTVAEDDNSNAKQQSVSRAVAESNNSSVNKQSLNWVVGEEDKTRTKTQPLKRVVLDDDRPRTVHESAKKKTKTLPMCRSMLIEDFLKENGEVGEELGDESSDDEQNVMVDNSSTKQPMKNTVAEDNNSRARSVAENKQPMKKAVVGNSSTKQTKKNTVAKHDNSNAKQQPMRRAVAESNNSSVNKQSMNWVVGEEDKISTRKQPVKRVVLEDDRPGTVHESAMTKTKTLPMCRSMLIDDFLKENGEVGEEDLGDESSDDEQNVMVDNSSTKQPVKSTVAEDDNSRAKQRPMRRAVAGNNKSSPNKQFMNSVVGEENKTRTRKHPMKRVVLEGDRPRTVRESAVKKKQTLPMCRSMLIEEFLKENGEVGEEELRDESSEEEENVMVDNSSAKQLMKNTVAEDDNSRAKQQPMRRAVGEANNSSASKQFMNRVVGEDKTRTRTQPLKRVVLEDDRPRTVHESAKKKTKTLPMCRSMLIEDFLKENGEVGEEELGDESSDDEQNVMIDNSSTKQPMKNTVAEDDNSRAKQQLMRRSVAERKQPMKKAVVGNSRTKQLKKNTVAEHDNSNAKQQPMRRAVAESNNSSVNKQSMNWVVGEEDKTSTRKQPMKRVVLEDDRPGTVHGSAMKKTKTLPMCRSMLIDDFLKENGEVGEEELGDESSDDEQNVMVDNSSTKQPMKNTVAEDDNSRAKQQPMRRAVAGNNKSSANKQFMNSVVGEENKTRTRKRPMKMVVLEGDRPRTVHESAMKKTKTLPMCRSMLIEEFLKENGELSEEELGDESAGEEQNVRVDNSSAKQPMKNTRVENDNSRAKQQPMRRAVAEAGNSSASKQFMNRVVGEEDKTRTTKQPMKRVVLEDDRPRAMDESATNKTKTLPMCRAMLIEEFLKENGEVGEEELGGESSEEEQNVMGHEESALQEEGDKTKGTGKRRTRGPTLCLEIHARHPNDRQEVILDEHGEPIGPDGQIVSDLSFFLGTIARNANFCPLIYTNFKALVKDNEELIWGYVNDKYVIPDKGRKAVFSRINDAWRRHKCSIKRNYFLKYSSMEERLKHCPVTIPKAHFNQLMTYWGNSTIQSISQKNAMNRAKQKYLHRMGPVNFARIRAQLRAKKGNGMEVTQPEMFIETRQNRKRKEVDKETQRVVAELKDSIQKSSGSETFRSLFGKEKSGKVRCFGRTLTPTMFQRNEEIAVIKKQHSIELTSLKREMEGLKFLVKSLLKQQNPNFDEEEVNGIMATALGNENTATPHSSTSNHVPHREKFLPLQYDEEGDFPQGIEEGIEEEEEEEYEEEEHIPQGQGMEEEGIEEEEEEEEEYEEEEHIPQGQGMEEEEEEEEYEQEEHIPQGQGIEEEEQEEEEEDEEEE